MLPTLPPLPSEDPAYTVSLLCCYYVVVLAVAALYLQMQCQKSGNIFGEAALFAHCTSDGPTFATAVAKFPLSNAYVVLLLERGAGYREAQSIDWLLFTA
jgi:hypothetical protein